MKRLFALFSAERNYSAISSFAEDSLSNDVLIKVRGGSESKERDEDPNFVHV